MLRDTHADTHTHTIAIMKTVQEKLRNLFYVRPHTPFPSYLIFKNSPLPLSLFHALSCFITMP